MLGIFDNIEETFSEALRVSLHQANKAEFWKGRFNLSAWGKHFTLQARIDLLKTSRATPCAKRERAGGIT